MDEGGRALRAFTVTKRSGVHAGAAVASAKDMDDRRRVSEVLIE